MKNTKVLKTLALAVSAALVMVLAGCGSNTASTQTQAPATEAPTTVAETTVAETTTEAPATEAATEATTEAEAPAVDIRFAGLTGPTTMGLIKVVDSEKYTFTLAGAADEVTPKLIQGELDMAAIPANLASVLYNNTQGKIRVLAVNTLGVLYITEKGDTVTDVASLKGKTIYATGKGSTPEYTLKHILKENGIDPENDVTIEFKSEPAEIVALLENAEGGVAMLPQPYVTAAMSKVEGLHIVLNLSEEWDKLGSDSKLITGVLVGRSDFIDANPEAVETFLNEYKESVDWVVNNTEEASELIDKYGIVKAAIAKKALPMCNITFISGEEMKTNLSGYLNVLFEANPKAVGGSLPGDDFYYGN